MHITIKNLLKISEDVKQKLPIDDITYKSPKIIAVSKTFKIDHIKPLIEHGHLDFGENKVQEAIDKWQVIKELNRNITFYQGLMDKWKREVDHYDASMSHGATSVDVQTKRDKAYSNYVSFKNKRDNAKRQLNNLTKRQPTLNDLSNPYYYSKKKNPFGAGTKPPSPKSKYLQLDDIND